MAYIARENVRPPLLRGEADFRQISVSLVFASWISHIARCAVKHGYPWRENGWLQTHFILLSIAPASFPNHVGEENTQNFATPGTLRRPHERRTRE